MLKIGCVTIYKVITLFYVGIRRHSWVSTMPIRAIAVAAYFGLYNGVCIEKIHGDITEVLEFASPNPCSSPLEFCCNVDLLNQFFLYFKSEAQELIKAAEKEPICFLEGRIPKLQNSSESHYNEFCASIKPEKINIKFKSKEVSFTRREFEVLNLMVKNKSMAEVAEILKLSRRTVEFYLYNAKNKTQLFTVNKLLDAFNDSLF